MIFVNDSCERKEIKNVEEIRVVRSTYTLKKLGYTYRGFLAHVVLKHLLRTEYDIFCNYFIFFDNLNIKNF